MGWWFRRRPRSHDGLVDSLVNRPWEWEPVELGPDVAVTVNVIGYRHASGVVVFSDGTVLGVQVGWECRYAIKDALLAHAAARVNCGKLFGPDPTARLLAEAVLKGDPTAALALADRIKETI